MIKAQINKTGWSVIKPKGFSELQKEALQEQIQDWHLRYLPKHFKRSAITDYGYAIRTAAYEQKKRRKYGHQDPLVWSGRTRRMALASIRISGTGKRARGVLNVEKYIYQYHKGEDATGRTIFQMDKAAELVATNQREAFAMARAFGENMALKIRNARDRETVKA